MAPTGLPGHRGRDSEQVPPVPVFWRLMEELYVKARRVAKLFNGTVGPRSAQIEAMKDLQALIYRLEDLPTSELASRMAPAPSELT